MLQRLPALVATLLKSTEPFIEQYFALDLPTALKEAGFRIPASVPATHGTV